MQHICGSNTLCVPPPPLCAQCLLSGQRAGLQGGAAILKGALGSIHLLVCRHGSPCQGQQVGWLCSIPRHPLHASAAGCSLASASSGSSSMTARGGPATELSTSAASATSVPGGGCPRRGAGALWLAACAGACFSSVAMRACGVAGRGRGAEQLSWLLHRVALTSAFGCTACKHARRGGHRGWGLAARIGWGVAGTALASCVAGALG
jgi:hypothetical protein